MPEHRVYVEPYAGGFSVGLRKPRAFAEVYNDLDSEISEMFRVLRDRGRELSEALYCTPFGREEFKRAWLPCDDELERARRVIVRSHMGFGSAAATESNERGRIMTGFRSNTSRVGGTPVSAWAKMPARFLEIVERLRGVIIENRDASDVMRAHDASTTLFYVDPPYVLSTRDSGSDYRFEMDDEAHRALAATLKSLKGKVIISGYECALYNDLFRGWRKSWKTSFASGAKKRVEVLWMNYRQGGAV